MSATSFFGGAFFDGDFFNTPSVTADVIRNFSLKEWRNWRRPEDDAELERIGIERDAAETIDAVAERQVAKSQLDEQKRLDELRGELALRQVEMRSIHIEALNARREQILRDEIGRILRAKVDEEATLVLMLMAGSW